MVTAPRPASRMVNQRALQEQSLRYFMEVVHAGSVTEAACTTSMK